MSPEPTLAEQADADQAAFADEHPELYQEAPEGASPGGPYHKLLSAQIEPWISLQKSINALRPCVLPPGSNEEDANWADPERSAVVGFGIGLRGLVEWALRRPKGDMIRAEVLCALESAINDGRIAATCGRCATASTSPKGSSKEAP